MADARSKASSKSSSKDQAPKVHPAVTARQEAENTPSPVQPIEVVRNVPEPDNEGAETVRVVNKPNLQQNGEAVVTAEDDPAYADAAKGAKSSKKSNKELCWNCANHGKSNELDDNNECSECGFQKESLYNLDYEAQKARQRELAGIQL